MKKRDILDEQQVTEVSTLLKASMGDVVGYAERLGVSVEDTVRYMSLGSRLKEAREDAGLSVKEIAKRLQVPQHRIRDAEKSAEKVLGGVLEKYVQLAGLGDWFKQWCGQNPELAKRILGRKGRSK